MRRRRRRRKAQPPPHHDFNSSFFNGLSHDVGLHLPTLEQSSGVSDKHPNLTNTGTNSAEISGFHDSPGSVKCCFKPWFEIAG